MVFVALIAFKERPGSSQRFKKHPMKRFWEEEGDGNGGKGRGMRTDGAQKKYP